METHMRWKHWREQFQPLRRLYLNLDESKSVAQFSGGGKAEAEKTQNAEDEKNAIQEAALKGKLDEVG